MSHGEGKYARDRHADRGGGRQLPALRGERAAPPFVVGIAFSDLHLSAKPPVARAGEPDWFKAMQRPIDQVKTLQARYKCPVIVAGDVFDRWNPGPELINFAIKHLPLIHAVPGQHDLPYHSYEDVRKSAYWTLVEANKVIDLKPGVPVPAGDHLLLDGYPWGAEVRPCKANHLINGYNVAVVHSYIWTKKNSYPGAPPESHVNRWRDRLRGYRVAVFGDNHKGFMIKDDKTTIVNCGGFTRRKTDEYDYRPKVALLWNTGDVTRVRLDTSEDHLLGNNQMTKALCEDPGFLAEFLDEITNLSDTSADYKEAVIRYLERGVLDTGVRRAVLRAMKEGEGKP